MSDQSLYDAIRGAGYLAPESIIWDGKLHRFATDAAKRHSKDGWYIAHDDAKGKAAAFGSWRDGGSHTWSNGTGRKLTQAELKDIEAQKKRALEDEKKRRQAAALRAQRIYEQAASDVSYSAYLARKGIDCPDGVRAVQGLSSRALGFDGDEFQVSGLIVPMRDRSGEIRSLQLIPEDAHRQKLFLRGGQTAGCFHVLGSIAGAQRVLIAEGLATAQSGRQATGLPAVVAFSAHNLPSVARAVRAQNATAEILILVDDDEAGRKYSAEAAHAGDGRAVMPGHGCNDFNDLHAERGLADVRAAILGEQEEDASWRADLITKHKEDGTSTTPCRVHNLILILRHAREFRGRVRLNEFSAQISIDGRDIDDVGPVRIKALLERAWIKEKVPTGDVVESMAVVASESPYHPVREYLDALRWDGIERIPSFFEDHFGCPRDPYHIAVALSLFISAVARIYRPGCKVDTMVILESIQGTGKTKLWIALFGEWSAEVTSSLNDKDFFSGLRGVWCADFGELDQFSKAETTRIKQVITQTYDHYRPHYGRQHQRFARQCIFVGGTNQDGWQTDPTGARRFLPIRVRQAIDVDAIAAARDQLWAEAVARFRRGETWWHIPDAQAHQEEAYQGDPWEAPVVSGIIGRHAVTVAEILGDFLGIDIGKQTRADQMRVAAILKRAGWERKRAPTGWVYRPKRE